MGTVFPGGQKSGDQMGSGLNASQPFMIGSPVVELPMVVDEIQDVEAGKPDEAVEKEMLVGPVVDPKVVADEPVVDSNVDPVEPIVVGKVVEGGVVENRSVEALATAVVLVGSDKIKERLLTFET